MSPGAQREANARAERCLGAVQLIDVPLEGVPVHRHAYPSRLLFVPPRSRRFGRHAQERSAVILFCSPIVRPALGRRHLAPLPSLDGVRLVPLSGISLDLAAGGV
jgi:hypothetical protein